MRFRRGLGGLLFGLGCTVTLLGALAALLPMIDNDQLRLVLGSFQAESAHVLVNALNGAMRYAMRNCYVVILCGAALMIAGLALMAGARGEQPSQDETPLSYGGAPSRAEPPQAYTVLGEDEAPEDVPVWGAKPAQDGNPFADPSLAAMLAPKVVPRAPRKELNPFAPPPESAADAAPYRRPKEEKADLPADTIPRPAYIPGGAEAQTAPSAQGASPRIKSTMGKHH